MNNNECVRGESENYAVKSLGKRERTRKPTISSRSPDPGRPSPEHSRIQFCDFEYHPTAINLSGSEKIITFAGAKLLRVVKAPSVRDRDSGCDSSFSRDDFSDGGYFPSGFNGGVARWREKSHYFYVPEKYLYRLRDLRSNEYLSGKGCFWGLKGRSVCRRQGDICFVPTPLSCVTPVFNLHFCSP